MARELSSRLDLPHVELDALYWEPEWTPAAAEVFRRRVAQALEADAWMTDGNYSALRDIVWPRADTIVWLDYRLRVVMWRLLWRTLRRVFTREELWSGNRERFSTQFFSRDSLFLWALKTYWRRRREYPALLKKPEYAHLRVARLRSPKAARRWVQGITHTRRGTASRRIVIPVLISGRRAPTIDEE